MATAKIKIRNLPGVSRPATKAVYVDDEPVNVPQKSVGEIATLEDVDELDDEPLSVDEEEKEPEE